MNQEDQFLRFIKNLYKIDVLNEDQRVFLKEVFAEIHGVMEQPEPVYLVYDLMFSEVEINRMFMMGGEDWCKISETGYVHMKSREVKEMAGDPVVSVTERQQ